MCTYSISVPSTPHSLNQDTSEFTVDSEQPLGGYQAHTEDMEMHVNKVYKFFHRVLSVCDGDPFSNV